MGTKHLTDAMIRALPTPAKGNVITYDDTDTGLGIRVTAAGHKAFVLGYSVRGTGRQRRYTIGDFGDWTCKTARVRARELRAEIDAGGDPLGDLEAKREAPDMAALIARFEAEHLVRKRENTASEYRSLLRRYVAPHFGKRKVSEVEFADVDRLHRQISGAGHPYRANRCVAVLSKLFNLAIHWKMRETNPCRGIERNREHARRRYLSSDELQRLTTALATFPEQDVADAVRLLLFTGARKNEVLSMRWDDLDDTGKWAKRPASTKQGRHHEVPLSAPARQLLAERWARKGDSDDFVFPGRSSKEHRADIWHSWQRLLKAASIRDLRIHDLRHSFASQLASGGASLPLIGALLGHTNPTTTARYAHLFHDTQLEAVERVGAAVMNAGQPARPSVPLRRRRD